MLSLEGQVAAISSRSLPLQRAREPCWIRPSGPSSSITATFPWRHPSRGEAVCLSSCSLPPLSLNMEIPSNHHGVHETAQRHLNTICAGDSWERGCHWRNKLSKLGTSYALHVLKMFFWRSLSVILLVRCPIQLPSAEWEPSSTFPRNICCDCQWFTDILFCRTFFKILNSLPVTLLRARIPP